LWQTRRIDCEFRSWLPQKGREVPRVRVRVQRADGTRSSASLPCLPNPTSGSAQQPRSQPNG
jgi:hypothetical protein